MTDKRSHVKQRGRQELTPDIVMQTQCVLWHMWACSHTIYVHTHHMSQTHIIYTYTQEIKNEEINKNKIIIVSLYYVHFNMVLKRKKQSK